jgi:hypothetical protein
VSFQRAGNWLSSHGGSVDATLMTISESSWSALAEVPQVGLDAFEPPRAGVSTRFRSGSSANFSIVEPTLSSVPGDDVAVDAVELRPAASDRSFRSPRLSRCSFIASSYSVARAVDLVAADDDVFPSEQIKILGRAATGCRVPGRPPVPCEVRPSRRSPS